MAPTSGTWSAAWQVPEPWEEALCEAAWGYILKVAPRWGDHRATTLAGPQLQFALPRATSECQGNGDLLVALPLPWITAHHPDGYSCLSSISRPGLLCALGGLGAGRSPALLGAAAAVQTVAAD